MKPKTKRFNKNKKLIEIRKAKEKYNLKFITFISLSIYKLY